MVKPLRRRQTKGAANRYAQPNAIAPHSYSTELCRSVRAGLPAGVSRAQPPVGQVCTTNPCEKAEIVIAVFLIGASDARPCVSRRQARAVGQFDKDALALGRQVFRRMTDDVACRPVHWRRPFAINDTRRLYSISWKCPPSAVLAMSRVRGDAATRSRGRSLVIRVWEPRSRARFALRIEKGAGSR